MSRSRQRVIASAPRERKAFQVNVKFAGSRLAELEALSEHMGMTAQNLIRFLVKRESNAVEAERIAKRKAG